MRISIDLLLLYCLEPYVIIDKFIQIFVMFNNLLEINDSGYDYPSTNLL